MDPGTVLVALALIFASAAGFVTLEDRRIQRKRAARVRAALLRIGEDPGRG